MSLIETTNFTLAVNQAGDANSEYLALLVPGRLDSKDYAHLEHHLQTLGELGYAAVAFDPPGTWESPGGIELYTTTNTLQAIKELIDYYDSRPTLMVGHSRGGSLSMLTAAVNDRVENYIAVMSHAEPSQTLSSLNPGGFEVIKRDMPAKHGQRTTYFRLPYSYFSDGRKYNYRQALRDCPKSKTFIMGQRDTVVPPEHVQQSYEMAADPKQLIEVDAEHNYRNDPEAIEQISRIIGQVARKAAVSRVYR